MNITFDQFQQWAEDLKLHIMQTDIHPGHKHDIRVDANNYDLGERLTYGGMADLGRHLDITIKFTIKLP